MKESNSKQTRIKVKKRNKNIRSEVVCPLTYKRKPYPKQFESLFAWYIAVAFV